MLQHGYGGDERSPYTRHVCKLTSYMYRWSWRWEANVALPTSKFFPDRSHRPTTPETGPLVIALGTVWLMGFLCGKRGWPSDYSDFSSDFWWFEKSAQNNHHFANYLVFGKFCKTSMGFSPNPGFRNFQLWGSCSGNTETRLMMQSDWYPHL